MRVEGKFNSMTEKWRLTCRRSADDDSDIDCCADNFSAVDCSPVKFPSIDCSFGNVRRVAMVQGIKLPFSCWCVLR